MSICKVSQSRGICAWYAMLNTPLQDGVKEMWNRTLMKNGQKYVKLLYYTLFIVDLCFKDYDVYA